MGSYPVSGDYDLLEEMGIFSLAILGLGLVLNIMVIQFVIISVLLIYSLLMITIENKTFDTGVMRLLGLNSGGFIVLIFTQALMFVIPSLIIAFLCVPPTLWFILTKLQGEKQGFSSDLLPDLGASLQGIAVGVIIPAISAIIPIQRALSKSLTDSLNVSRSQTTGIIYTVENASKVKILPYLLFGSISVIFGTTIYYFLPYGLLTFNAALILNIFFIILMGMILGVTLLALNLRGVLEKVLIHTLLVWEKKSMKTLLKKNLIAHKRTNQLTSVIYALSLGCVIFLIVAATLQIAEINSLTATPGIDLIVT